MATIVRGVADAEVLALQTALTAYEAANPGADAALYRNNPASIRVRVIDRRFEGMVKSRRHAHVWEFLAGQVDAGHLDADLLADVSQLLTLAPAELGTNFANLEFEAPQPAQP